MELLATLQIVDKYANDRVIWVDYVKMNGDVGHKINWSRLERLRFKKDELWERRIRISLSQEYSKDLPFLEQNTSSQIKKWGLKKKG